MHGQQNIKKNLSVVTCIAVGP